MANLGNDHGFINKEYSLHWYEAFWEALKQSHESLFSKWTISYHYGESCSSNMVSEPCPKLSRTKAVKNDQDSKGVEPRLRGGMLCSRGGVG